MNPAEIKLLEYESRQEFKNHSHRETQITLILAGEAHEWVGNNYRVLQPLDIVIKPAGLIHANQIGQRGAKTIQFAVNQEWWRAATSANDSAGSYQTVFCSTINQVILNQYLLTHNRNVSLSCRRDFAIDLINHVLNLKQQGARSDKKPPDWIASIRRDIEIGYCEAVSVNRFANRYHKHPVSVARAFRSWYGQTIKQAVHHLRVRRVAQLLDDESQCASEISLSCGFSDQSHMNRVFKTHTGLPPVAFRRLLLRKSA